MLAAEQHVVTPALERVVGSQHLSERRGFRKRWSRGGARDS